MAKIDDSDPPMAKAGVDPEASDGIGLEMEGLTLYEKKSLLVNQELDAMGMGKYQWYIFILCGFGYMLDLLWAQAFGLVASPLQQELGFSGLRLCNRRRDPSVTLNQMSSWETSSPLSRPDFAPEHSYGESWWTSLAGLPLLRLAKTGF